MLEQKLQYEPSVQCLIEKNMSNYVEWNHIIYIYIQLWHQDVDSLPGMLHIMLKLLYS